MSASRRIASYLRNNVLALVAIFLALSGIAWAVQKAPKNSVVTKSIKKGAVTKIKIKDGAVTEAKLGEGAVTSAKLGAASVGSSKLDPALASQLGPQCAAGLTLLAGNLCYEPQTRAPVGWLTALDICAKASLRMPTLPELAEIMDVALAGTNADAEWGADTLQVGVTGSAQTIGRNPGNLFLGSQDRTIATPYRCVESPH